MTNLFKCLCFAAILLLAWEISAIGQSQPNIKVDPTHWWTQMKNPKLQLLISGPNVAKEFTGVSVNYPGVEVVGNRVFENPNYIAVDLMINSRATPGKFQLEFEGNPAVKRLSYEIKARSPDNGRTRI